MGKSVVRNLFILFLFCLVHGHVSAQVYERYVGDDVLLVAPSPPQGAIFQTAWAGQHSALSIISSDTYSARVKITDYFSGIAQVRCDYYWYYYLDGRQYTRHATTYFDIRCKQVNVMLDASYMTLNVGSGAYLRASISPSNIAVKPTLTWSSSNYNVASVNNNGYVVAKSAGTAVITVTTSHNTYASCTVVVQDNTPPPTPPGGDDGDDDGGDDGDDDGGDNDDEGYEGSQYLEVFIDKAKRRVQNLKVKIIDYI